MKKVLISGTGVAGIICAILLDKDKYEIDMIEKGDTFRNIGYSLTLWKNGFDLLNKILGKAGVNITEGKDYFRVKNYILFGGSRLKKLKSLDSNGLTWSFDRGHLMKLLEKVLFSNFNRSKISFSTTISEIKKINSKEVVKLSNGLTKEYDAVIIAEGINSTTRRLLFKDEEKIVSLNYNLQYKWFSKETDLEENGALFITQGHLGVIHPPYTRNLIGYYSKVSSSNSIKKQFEDEVLKVIKQTDKSETSFDDTTSHVFDLKEIYIPSYYYNNTVFIGDAAHGRPPTLGFGTSVAIEDAVQISEVLNNLEKSEALNTYLEAFSVKRIKRVEEIYRFQKFIHTLITENRIKVRVISLFLSLIIGKYIEHKVRNLISKNYIEK